MKITGQTRPCGDRNLCAAEAILLRYGLALIFFWIGAMKFTAYEAEGIRPLAENSPLMGWLLAALGIRAFSNLLGVIEIATGVLLALRPVSARATVIGSGIAIATFLTTLTFLFTTPGWERSLGGFPALSALPGQFLLKDVVLLGAAVWSLREALTALRTRQPGPRFDPALGQTPSRTIREGRQQASHKLVDFRCNAKQLTQADDAAA
jgi:reactive chlorine resistance protein C